MSPKLPRIAAATLLRALHRGGWYIVRQTGSHVQLKHPERQGRLVTVAKHGAGDIPPKLLASVLDQAGLSADELRELL